MWRRPSNWAVLFQYLLPYFGYVGVLVLLESAVPKPVAFALATIASGAAIAWEIGRASCRERVCVIV